jgi:hypothetical protein
MSRVNRSWWYHLAYAPEADSYLAVLVLPLLSLPWNNSLVVIAFGQRRSTFHMRDLVKPCLSMSRLR